MDTVFPPPADLRVLVMEPVLDPDVPEATEAATPAPPPLAKKGGKREDAVKSKLRAPQLAEYSGTLVIYLALNHHLELTGHVPL